jgi:hypothetical protein
MIPEKYKPAANRALVCLGTLAATAAYAKYGPGGQAAVEAVWPYVVSLVSMFF